MRDWKKWNANAEHRRERARRAAEARWEAARESRSDEPVRQTRVVELTIRDTHRCRRTIVLRADEGFRGWGRWLVSENGERIGRRRFGRSAIAALIARSLE